MTRIFTAAADRYVANSAGTYQLRFLGGADRLTVRAGTVAARLGDGDDFARVDGGRATLFGDAGADRFEIYANRASLYGGAGNDVVNVRGGSNHRVNGGTGADRINLLFESAGVMIRGGEANDLFLGNGLNIGGEIHGDEGADRFHGFGHVGGRAVTLYGGTGNDIYHVGNAAAPAIVELADQGIDTIRLAPGISYTLGANVENLAVTGGASTSLNIFLTGNVLANRIMGSGHAERLSGGGGNDILSAGGGTDTVSGGDGNDRITGGAAVDYIETGAGRDVIVYTSIADAPANPPMGFEEIGDFDFARDLIDVSAIDADTTRPGHQQFHLGGTGAGSIEWGVFAGMDVLLHTDDDGEPDMWIYIGSATESVPLTADHFIF